MKASVQALDAKSSRCMLGSAAREHRSRPVGTKLIPPLKRDPPLQSLHASHNASVKSVALYPDQPQPVDQYEIRFGNVATGSRVSYMRSTPTELRTMEDAEDLDEEAAEVIQLMPKSLASALEQWRFKSALPLMEIALDVGRPPVVMLMDRSKVILRDVPMVSIAGVVTNLAAAAAKHGDGVHGYLFGTDGRMTLPNSLHRISRLQDPRDGQILGLTLRVGRHVGGQSGIFADILSDVAKGEVRGILLLGPPGTGKTTLLRDIVRALSDEHEMSVMVVDTSNEIAGGGHIPHASIGSARRIMVGERADQHKVLLEAVQNHTPQIVVVDEISNKAEVAAARTISQRGVIMVATAHGNNLSSLLSNPELVSLVGDIQTVTVGDTAARGAAENSQFRKLRTERKAAPVFDVVIELLAQGQWRLHRDVSESVDSLLSGGQADAERRRYGSDGKQMLVHFETQRAAELAHSRVGSRPG